MTNKELLKLSERYLNLAIEIDYEKLILHYLTQLIYFYNVTQLKPCPFCGKQKSVEIDEIFKEWFVVCSFYKKGCGASTGHWYLNKQQAIKVWNTRTS